MTARSMGDWYSRPQTSNHTMHARSRQWLRRWLAAMVMVALPPIAWGEACEANTASNAVPTPAELEHRGTRIGNIDVEVEDIFDPTRPGEGATPYRLANDLHLRTRDDVIRAQLLFGEDEPFSQQKIAETERLLRGRRYLYDAWIEPVCYYEAEQTVDLRVRVRDVWSLNPGFSFNRKGGTNKVGVDVEDQDFLGRGELVSLSWGRNVDRDSLLGVYEDPQILGTWWRGRVAYADNTDGSFGELGVGQPFYSLDTRWSAGLGLVAGDRVNSRYAQGKVLDAYTEATDRFEIYGGRSHGLQDGWARRWLAGVRSEDSRFHETPGETLVGPLPQDRKLVYPWVGVEWVEDDFGTVHNQDQLARTEDLQFGRSLRAELGLASPAWGADRTATVARVHSAAGKRFDDGQSMFFTADLTGRLESDGLRDTLLQGEARYYNRQTKHALFFASARGAIAQHPDLDHQLLLGGDNGLRGYPLRYQSGTASALVTLEERFYTDWYPFHLFNIGAAAFADAGRAWGQDVAGEEPLGLLSDVGVGLRIGNARSGLGNVLHIDVAVPLSRQPGIDAVQFLIETRRGF
jgi:hypothetical protein